VDDYALVLNAGSSSLKFNVYCRPEAESWGLAARGQIEGIGTAPRLAAKDGSGEKLADEKLDAGVKDGRKALDALAAWLRARWGGSRVLGVGHRVVHGGALFDRPTVVTRTVLAELQKLVPLAPLHQPYNLAAIEAVYDRLPDVPQVACFDTSFHRGQPAVAELVPLPREIARGRVIVAHLGSGASVCALRNGKSVDSSLGFTALDGLCMGTRPGGLDPGVVLYLFQGLGLSAKEVEAVLYKKSGLLGVSGTSNDMRDLLESSAPAARLAVDYFVYQAAKEIGALAAVLRGIDGLVFTAGIGENSPEIRRRIGEACGWLGVEIDAAANDARGPRISTKGSKVSAWVIPTNEELMIARHTGRLLGLTGTRADQTESRSGR
jgi:acetate kinase